MSGLFGEPEADELPPPPPSGPGLFGEDPPAPSAAPASAPATPGPATPYRVLARKYRPKTFDDLYGQDLMVRILRRAFELNRLAHAWMLTGVRGTGKTTTARIIARGLNCTGPDGTGGPTADPCGVCPNCLAILDDRHPDVTEMDAASNTGVDDVREVIDATRYRPLQARYRVFIIDEVHMLSRNAFNALLKTLEEPPPHVKFVFATTEIRKVPVTVLSRCQRFDLRRVRVAELVALFRKIAELEGARITDGALDLLARAADGSARDGLSLLDQAIAQGMQGGGMQGGGVQGGDAESGEPIGAPAVEEMLGLADRTTVFDLLDSVMAGDTRAVMAATARVHERGGDMGALLHDLLSLVHTVTRLRAAPELAEGNDLPEAERVRGALMAQRLTVPVLGRAWQMLMRGAAEVDGASDRRAAAEMVLLRMCFAADLPTPGDLVRQLSDGASPARPSGGGGPVRAVANGSPVAAVAQPVPDPVPPPTASLAPTLNSFRDVAQLVAAEKEPMLHGFLLHAVHLVRFAPGVIELRPEPDAPRDLAQKLAALLLRVTGTRWTIAVSREPGEPTLAEQGRAADVARRGAAEEHPLVRAILDAFPGARIQRLDDTRLDEYGLLPDLEPTDAVPLDDDSVVPEFAPIDSLPEDTMEDDA